MSIELEERLIALEIRLTHHEIMAEDMSEILAKQAETIDLLTLQLHRLHGRLREMAAGWQPSPQDEKPPPHY